MDKTERYSYIEKAKEHFAGIMIEQLDRIEKMKKGEDWSDFEKIDPVIIGVCWGDGIGKEISKHAQRVLEHVLIDQKRKGKVEFRVITGLTIENRVKHSKAVPDDVLAEIKKCHVLLKGPTTTPQAGDKWPNIESANVALRRELDLFANVRPVKVPKEGIDWCFFRENTEGAYVLGSKGINVTEDLSVDFTIMTEQGAERIVRMAFEYAKKNKYNKVTAVTKANVVKTTDGRFSRAVKRIAGEYKSFGIGTDEWYIDIMTAKLLDVARRNEFQVMVLPNLYGDILTDEAAQIQGGVGTAGSANIGKRWAMFEAIHGSAPRMVEEGREKYADPSSMIRASAMLTRHIGHPERADRLERALEIAGQYEKKISITGRSTGATGEEFTSYLLDCLNDPDLENKWEEFSVKK
ncbi:MAG: isocitrate/isopropylmalate dehydrogenase family protein [Candidatus Omnitrophica bacterium]|nr:isocitrate/isopropylmalate dehydrogenase family protein [Candidatus Omnitrophota bacterium]